MQGIAGTIEEYQQLGKIITETQQKIAMFKNAGPAANTTQVNPMTGFDSFFDDMIAAAGAYEQKMKDIDKATHNAKTAFALLSPSIDEAFNALANGENAFEGVKQALKRLLIDLAKAAALSLVLSAISSGAGGAGGGFLSIFKSVLGFRANGGPVNSGGPYIVGESGPELFVPSSAGQIVPNMALGGGGGQLQAVVSGNDLLFILNQAGMNRRNNFG